jgi:hypothetical protein
MVVCTSNCGCFEVSLLNCWASSRALDPRSGLISKFSSPSKKSDHHGAHLEEIFALRGSAGYELSTYIRSLHARSSNARGERD